MRCPHAQRGAPKDARRRESGQATVEYAWIAFALLAGATLAGWPYLRLLLAGLAAYLDGVYAVLDGPLP